MLLSDSSLVTVTSLSAWLQSSHCQLSFITIMPLSNCHCNDKMVHCPTPFLMIQWYHSLIPVRKEIMPLSNSILHDTMVPLSNSIFYDTVVPLSNSIFYDTMVPLSNSIFYATMVPLSKSCQDNCFNSYQDKIMLLSNSCQDNCQLIRTKSCYSLTPVRTTVLTLIRTKSCY